MPNQYKCEIMPRHHALVMSYYPALSGLTFVSEVYRNHMNHDVFGVIYVAGSTAELIISLLYIRESVVVI